MLRRPLQLVIFVILLATTVLAGEIIERVIATVNGTPILQSDWDDAVRYEAFANHRPLDRVSSTQRKAALDHLIDQELLRQQMNDADLENVSPQDVAIQIGDIRKQYTAASTAAAWSAALRQYGLTEKDLERHVSVQLSLERLIDVRLRPTIHISRTTIEAYYRDQLLPELRKSGVHEIPLVEVSPKIEELLTQRRMNELLSAWLKDLRVQSEIRVGEDSQGVSAQ